MRDTGNVFTISTDEATSNPNTGNEGNTRSVRPEQALLSRGLGKKKPEGEKGRRRTTRRKENRGKDLPVFVLKRPAESDRT